MRIDTPFDPIFTREPTAEGDAAASPRGLLFDGWSYRPVPAPRDDQERPPRPVVRQPA